MNQLRSKSSGLLLKNILRNKFAIKLSNFEKWKFIEILWTSIRFGGIIQKSDVFSLCVAVTETERTDFLVERF